MTLGPCSPPSAGHSLGQCAHTWKLPNTQTRGNLMTWQGPADIWSTCQGLSYRCAGNVRTRDQALKASRLDVTILHQSQQAPPQHANQLLGNFGPLAYIILWQTPLQVHLRINVVIELTPTHGTSLTFKATTTKATTTLLKCRANGSCCGIVMHQYTQVGKCITCHEVDLETVAKQSRHAKQ